jgi:hypothetical protein
MKRWRNSLILLGSAATLAIALPALSQETKAPESILPPGFGDPDTPPPPPPPPEANETDPRTDLPPRAAPPRPREEISEFDTVIENAAAEDLEALEALQPPPPVEIPDFARRPVDVVGVLEPGTWGLEYDAFGRANGRFLSTLMRRADAPLPSRWMSILLRRALLSRVPAPSFVHPVDWVAERAWLLLRMGEADAARMLVQSIDVDQFTPKMFAVAVQTALATSDPAALCPLVVPGRETSDEPVWPLADAMCAALEGESGRASTLMDQARRRSRARGIDLTLAEKVVGAGVNTRRAVSIQWDDVDGLNSWRFGLASATGLEIPERLLGNAGAHVRAWHARAPMVPLEQRIASAQTAASLGVFSSASMVEIYSLLADNTDPSEMRDSVGGKLRAAYVSRNPAARMDALRGLWRDGGNDPAQRHARLILTATAAARIAPSVELAADAPQLLASMLSAGYDARAARWSNAVEAMEGKDGDRAWALVALASQRPRVEISSGRIGTFQGNDDSNGQLRSKMLVAALGGLDRIPGGVADLAEEMNIPVGKQNRWTRLLERAVQSRQQGTVALLAAAGMQTGGWAGVPPEHLYHIVSALRRVGLEYEARMIAAEALARL